MQILQLKYLQNLIMVDSTYRFVHNLHCNTQQQLVTTEFYLSENKKEIIR